MKITGHSADVHRMIYGVFLVQWLFALRAGQQKVDLNRAEEFCEIQFPLVWNYWAHSAPLNGAAHDFTCQFAIEHTFKSEENDVSIMKS